MVQIHKSSSSKHYYLKQTLWIYFIPSNIFLLLPPMSVSVDLFIFLCFHDDLEYHCVLVLQETFVRWPNHRKRCCTSFSWICVTPNLSRISSFLVWPYIQRNIRISVTLTFWMCCHFVAQYSTPFIIGSNRHPVELAF
jgi:hypothetical protein